MRFILRPNHANLLGPAIRQARLNLPGRLTQDELAARLQVLGLEIDRTVISRIESQKRALSDIELVFFLKALRINFDRLLEFAMRYPDVVPLYPEIAKFQSVDILVAEPASKGKKPLLHKEVLE